MSAPEIVIRPLTGADAHSLCETVQASLAQLCYWMPWCKPDYALADAQAWIDASSAAWQRRSEFPMGIVERSTGRIIGATGISQLNTAFRIGNIGYWVGTPYAGRGVARLAAQLVARFGFDELALTRLEIVTLTHNHASQRVAEALGAVRECHARNRLYFQGEPHDAVVYSLIPGDLVS
jgi:ribosomal-protein-serine acetyltransferase